MMDQTIERYATFSILRNRPYQKYAMNLLAHKVRQHQVVTKKKLNNGQTIVSFRFADFFVCFAQ